MSKRLEIKVLNNRAFLYVTTLFFSWGFVTATMDPLIPTVRSVFQLSYTESMLTQFAFFLAYGVVSLPAAGVLARLGFARSIILAIACMVAGCLIIPLATAVRVYPLVLLALFVIASGITLLQVAANPLAAALGPPERSHFRLTLSQAFNSLGTVLAPYIGAFLLLRGGVFSGDATSEVNRAATLRSIDISFLAIAVALVVLAVFVWRVRKTIEASTPADAAINGSIGQAFRSKWALFGALAIFLYVGAEVSIGSVMINYLEQPSALGVTAEKASKLLAYYWLGAMIGRLAGSALLTKLHAAVVLGVAAVVASLLCLFVVLTTGAAPAYAAISIGLFNSIMFPTIFTLTLQRSSAPASATSGLLCMAIVGGAILPLAMGFLADTSGLSMSFIVPLLAYAAIGVFAVVSGRSRGAGNLVDPVVASH